MNKKVFWSALILATFWGTPYFDLDFDLENDIGGQNDLDFRNQRAPLYQIGMFSSDSEGVQKPMVKKFLSTEYQIISGRFANMNLLLN